MRVVTTEDIEDLGTATSDPPWDYLSPLSHRLQDSGTPDIAAFREALTEGDNRLKQRFADDEPVERLVRDRARLVDTLLKTAWKLHVGDFARDVALIAVGGYGRGELNLCSDIDIMILLPKSESMPWQSNLERFLTFMWDIGLEVGHSVRTIDDCQRESAADVSVATTMIEARLLTGPEQLFEAMRRALAPERVWPTRDFFEAKVAEQTARHHRYHDTAYNLEPNVKSSPGGLRDIQTIGWVAKRHFNADSLDELVDHGFLTRAELRKLKTAQAFLWKVRFALHVLTNRREDRLLFDHQIKLAKMFGYEDATYTLAVEQFMQRYYRTAMDVALLNEMLLQLFREAILSDANVTPVPVNPRFQIRSDYVEITSEDVFDRYPSALLELFVVIEQHPEIRGVRAATIREITRHLWLIDEEFRQHPRNHRLFFDILSAPVGVTHELRRMNLYGVLGRYIPAFGRIVGRMQYDLFHAYTVDAHTLFVVSNLRRLAMPKYDHEFPALSRIMQSLPKPELAYLAALFHDIAKGRGGDHSELGSVDAEAFCLEQGLSRYDARLVAWLVRNHLILSVTAQKKDISDPKVLHEFAKHVGDQNHLDYLYVLTVSDVRGTNPKLWNNWKASLFSEFYERTKQALRRGLESPIDREELIAETQAHARELIGRAGIAEAEVSEVWPHLTDDYFLRHTPEEIAWHTRLLAAREPGDDSSLVSVEQQSGRGGTAISTYTPQTQHSFARTTALLDQLGLNIVDARITPTGDGFSLDVYHVLEDTGAEITDMGRIRDIERHLAHELAKPDAATFTTVTRRAPRQVRMFTTATQITFVDDPVNQRTIIELIAGDRPGLLSQIAKVFMNERIEIYTSKIMTVGERAEDVFYVTGERGAPLDAAAREHIAAQLTAALDRRE
ncbi:MAG TPA: [protein-PII] uridylyltransferase [Povalibacter sp.]|uniref:[protein-PII] uridylyltransferase n=1 Tax=Povalibacter sp. TaxID=1962978 RepID=UPI002B69D82A|nr:[protein-PII] uridylyltransferase [Povalibacter sp.]HMN46236.1 [protein-PII] uridylyltransferase [Povalibacter sp.]